MSQQCVIRRYPHGGIACVNACFYLLFISLFFSIWRVVSTHLSLRAEHKPNNGISVERSTFGNKVTKCFTEKKKKNVTAGKKIHENNKRIEKQNGINRGIVTTRSYLRDACAMPFYNRGYYEKIEDSSLVVRKKRHWVKLLIKASKQRSASMITPGFFLVCVEVYVRNTLGDLGTLSSS